MPGRTELCFMPVTGSKKENRSHMRSASSDQKVPHRRNILPFKGPFRHFSGKDWVYKRNMSYVFLCQAAPDTFQHNKRTHDRCIARHCLQCHPRGDRNCSHFQSWRKGEILPDRAGTRPTQGGAHLLGKPWLHKDPKPKTTSPPALTPKLPVRGHVDPPGTSALQSPFLGAPR